MEKLTVNKKELEAIRKRKAKLIDWNNIKIPKVINEIFITETDISMYFNGDGTRSDDWDLPIDKMQTYQVSKAEAMINNKDLHKCLINLPTLRNMKNPTTLQNICNHQQANAQLLDALQTMPTLFQYRTINNVKVIIKMENATEWKIILPNAMLHTVIRWYHLLLNHPGSQRLYDTISCQFYNNNLPKLCGKYKCPDNCTMYKHQGKRYSHLPARNLTINPF